MPQGGYLNSFTTDHAAVSNGIVDSHTFFEVISKGDWRKFLSNGAQVYFSLLFEDKLADFTDKYRCLFKSNQILEETHDRNLCLTEDIFRPIQYLSTGEIEFQKVVVPLLVKRKEVSQE